MLAVKEKKGSDLIKIQDLLIQENQDFTNDIQHHLENIETYLCRLQIDHNKDYFLLKSLNYLLQETELLQTLISKDPRFDWKFIQDIIDKQFSKDDSLTGVNILFDWKKSEIPNRSSIKVNLFNDKKSKLWNI